MKASMMGSSILRSETARGARWYPLLAAAPYLVVAVLVVFAVIAKRGHGQDLLIDLILCGVLVAWIFLLFQVHPRWRSRPVVMTVFIAGLIAIIATLVERDSWFGALAIVGYMFVFAVISWPWQLIALTVFGIIAGTAQASGLPENTPFGLSATLVIICVNVLAVCGFAWLHHSNAQQSSERLRALEAARAANRRLELTLAENAILHERLLTEARRAGTLDERQRMAREIHDTLAQGLIGIITQLQAADDDGRPAPDWSRHHDAATALARRSLSEARRSVLALRPEVLEASRLGDALIEVAERWSELSGVTARVTTTGTVRPVAAAAEEALLRVVQEALTNVAKHADASTVVVTLSYFDDEIALDVRDDGIGFAMTGSDAPPKAPTRWIDGGFGLVTMRQRIEEAAGTLNIESEPGWGTAVSARVSVEPVPS